MVLESTSRERSAAAAMHIGTIFAPIVAPLIALGIGRESPFLCAHAKLSLKETLVLQAALVILGACSIAYSAWSLYGHYQNNWQEFSIWPIIAKAALIWVLLAVLQLVNTVQSIRQALFAYRGECPDSKRSRRQLQRTA